MRRPWMLLAVGFAGCASVAPPAPRADPAGSLSVSDPSVTLPVDVPGDPLPRRVVARGLHNPRGLHRLADGTLLVSEAGTGDPADGASGRLLRLADLNDDGDFDDEGERTEVLSGLRSENLLHVVRRDEVFGMAGIAEGGGVVLVSLAFFGGPSTLYAVTPDGVTPWGSTHGNINDIAFDPQDRHWYGAASTTDEVVRLLPGGRAERVVKLPTLASGQDSVPGYLTHDPSSGTLLVSLFSGSPEGEEGGDGTELVPGSAGIVSVDPDTRAVRWVVRGLTVPVDLEVGPDGAIYVLEFCDSFLDPVPTREALALPGHGGFRRFSGRLLRVDRRSGGATVLADGLDAPTNLLLVGDSLYVSQGMGTPGRPIPGPAGTIPLDGFIERFDLPAPGAGAPWGIFPP